MTNSVQSSEIAAQNLAEVERYTHWLEDRLQHWRAISESARGARADRTLEQSRDVMDGYRALARDLSIARRKAPGTRVHRALESLYAQTHDALNAKPRNPLTDIWLWFSVYLPAAVRALRGEIIFVTALFVATTLGGFLCVAVWPETADLFMSETMMRMVQNGVLWTDDLLNVVPSSMLSYQLMTNNISVALTAFALGLIYGLGTLYIISLNGMMLGAVFAYTSHYQMELALFRFIVAHGLVELSVICLSGAAGMAIGRALARPGPGGRVEALRETAAPALALAAASIPFLIGSGVIEGYVSPNDNFGLGSRVVIGVLWFCIFLVALDGRIWRYLKR